MENFRAIEPSWQSTTVYFTLGEPAAKTWAPTGIMWHYVIGDRRVYIYHEEDGTFGPWVVVRTGPAWAISSWELERLMVRVTDEQLREEIPISARLFPLADDKQCIETPSLPWGLTERSR